jgi:hypothetical protein
MILSQCRAGRYSSRMVFRVHARTVCGESDNRAKGIGPGNIRGMGHAALQRLKLMGEAPSDWDEHDDEKLRNESDQRGDSFAIHQEILKLMDEFRGRL